MGFNRGPKSTTNGLVLYYDTGNIKSYVGEPTVNSIVGGSDCANGVSAPWLVGGHAGCVVTGQENVWYSKDRPHVYRYFSTNNTGYAMINQQSSVQNVSGQTYTYSVEFKPIKGDYSGISNSYSIYPNGYKIPAGISGGNALSSTVTELEDGWYRWVLIYACTYTGNNAIRFNLFTGGYNGNSTGDFEVLFDNFQFEAKDHITQFTSTERTTTQGLIDLTRSRTLNLSNVSFDSGAQIIFDGTDDFIDLNDNPHNGLNEGTWEFVVNFDVVHDNETGTYRQLYIQEASVWVGQYFDYIGIDIAKDNGSWFDGSGGLSTNSQIGPVNSGQFYHAVFTWDGANVKGYLNGQLGFTTAISGLTSLRNGSTPRRIGRRSGNPLMGDMPIVKLYGKSLTADEVFKNFMAIKSRFNIS